MKKKTIVPVAAIVMAAAAVILLLRRCPAEPSPVTWNTVAERPRLIKNSGFENRLRSVLFLNEIYRNYRDFSTLTPAMVNRYDIDLSSVTVMRGRARLNRDRIAAKGKSVVIGLTQVGSLLSKKKPDVLTMVVSADRDIDIKVFEMDREVLPYKELRKSNPETLRNPAPRFIFLGKIPGSKTREKIDIELRNYAVKQRNSCRHLLLSISGSAAEEIGFTIHELSLKSHQARIVESYPAVHFFKTGEQWQKSLFIPGNSTVRYLIHARKPFVFDGCLGAFPGETPLYEIKANGKLLLSRQGAANLPYFSTAISPHEGKALVEISVRSKGNSSSTGVVGKGTFFYQQKNAANIVFYLIDALRRDFGGIEKSEREKLFESHFAGGAVFENAYANATWTGDSLPVIFTGKYKFSLVAQPQDHPNLSAEEYLLGEYLKTAGYTCAAFITNSFLVKDNAAQGFDVAYLCWGKGRGLSPFPTEEEYRDFKYGNMERYLREFTEQNRHKKICLFIHTVEPHDPYELPESKRRYSRGMDREVLKSVNGRFKDRLTSPTPEQVAALKALYKDEVLAAHRFFATTSQMLAGENILNKNALFLLTADHGERFFEHGSWLHAEPDVYNEVLAIPMMIKGAGFPAGRFRENVQLADIFPTIMEWLGDQKRQEMNGFSLLQLFSGDAADHFKNRVIYADGAKQPLLYSAIIGNLKIIVKGDTTEVYDLKTDPGETTNLAARKEFAAVIQVARGFRDNVKTRGKKKKQTVSEAELQRLKSLGYID